MSPLAIFGISMAIMFLLLFVRVPVFISLLLTGIIGIIMFVGTTAAWSILRIYPYSYSYSYTFSVIPMFVLMGQVVYHAGFASEIYYAAYCWLGRFRGGLAIASVAACAQFAAASGSSVATAGSLGPIGLKEMVKYEYDGSFASGTLAAGGTLGILIPPSTAMVVIGIITETSIGKLLMAGLLPGIILALLFILVIIIRTRLNPGLAPASPNTIPRRERAYALAKVWPILMLFLSVIGGLYYGVFTPTEAGSIGAFIAIIIAVIARRFSKNMLTKALSDTLRTTCMLMAIIIGAMVFSFLLARTGIIDELSDFITGLNFNRYITLCIIIIMYLILGALMDTFAMIVITLPVVFPVLVALGFDPLLIGVIIVVTIEAAMITPPIGMNLFVIQSVGKEHGISLGQISLGALPFVGAMIVLIIIMVAWPDLVLYLPNQMVN